MILKFYSLNRARCQIYHETMHSRSLLENETTELKKKIEITNFYNKKNANENVVFLFVLSIFYIDLYWGKVEIDHFSVPNGDIWIFFQKGLLSSKLC